MSRLRSVGSWRSREGVRVESERNWRIGLQVRAGIVAFLRSWRVLDILTFSVHNAGSKCHEYDGVRYEHRISVTRKWEIEV